jgi:hypothetical protein
MASSSGRSKKQFTIEQANAMLPLVRAITEDLTTLARDVAERRQRLTLLTAGRELEAKDPYAGELAAVEEELKRDIVRLQEYVKELEALGVEPKGALDGLVDFPAVMDGRPVYLCWKLGEPEVLYWHELNAGFVGRQPLTAGAGSSEAGDHQQLGL